MNKLLTGMLLSTALFLLSCSSDDNTQDGLVNLRVNYFTLGCEALFSTQCLQVQEGGEIGGDEWFNFFGSIENFDFEAGFVYDLAVQKTKVENPPADGSSFNYRLVRIVSKTEASCTFQNPTADLEWLRIEIQRREASVNEFTKYCYISQAEFNGNPVFVYFDCNPAINKIFPVYSCLGEYMGYLGVEDINPNDVTNFEIVWQPEDFACAITQ